MYFFTKPTMNFIAALITSLMCLTLGTTACKNETPPAEKKVNFRYELSKDKGWKWFDQYGAYSRQLYLKIDIYRLPPVGLTAEQQAKNQLWIRKESCGDSCGGQPIYLQEKIGETTVYVLELPNELTWITYAYLEKEGHIFKVEMTDQVDKKTHPENWGEFETAVKTLDVYEE